MSVDKFNIDGHKLHLHPERIAQWLRDPLNTYPIYIEISPVGHCNHRCTFCAVDYIGYEPRALDVPTLSLRLDEMASLGVKSVMFAGEGEPMLHKQISKIVHLARHAGLDVSFTTNGTLLYKVYDVLPSIEWIKVSCNAGDKETYAKIHRCPEKDWDTVWSNIAGARQRSSTLVLGIQTLVLPDNIHSIPDLIKKAQEVGASYVVLKPYSQHLSSKTHQYEDVQYVKYKEELAKLGQMDSKECPVLIRTESMEEWDSHEHKYQKCNATPYFWAYIMATGDVYSCSAYLLDPNFNMGNINNQSFSEIWTSERRRNHIVAMQSLDISKCRLNCRMNKVNKYLDHVVNKPEHSNFI